MAKYTIYWFKQGRKYNHTGEETFNGTLERAIEIAKATGNIKAADGVSLYDAKGTLIGDWSYINHDWHANVRPKKKDKDWHPFGL